MEVRIKAVFQTIRMHHHPHGIWGLLWSVFQIRLYVVRQQKSDRFNPRFKLNCSNFDYFKFFVWASVFGFFFFGKGLLFHFSLLQLLNVLPANVISQSDGFRGHYRFQRRGLCLICTKATNLTWILSFKYMSDAVLRLKALKKRGLLSDSVDLS